MHEEELVCNICGDVYDGDGEVEEILNEAKELPDSTVKLITICHECY